MNEVEVTVCCITYNHAKYVRKCLDGLVEQKTNFSFEILIYDDASTDETIEIIKEYVYRYPKLFVLMLQKENQYSKGNRSTLTQFMLPKARGKYIAVCEGDDFWCDQFKLQKQYDALQRYENCNMCTHRVEIVRENGDEYGACIPQRNISCGEMKGKTLIDYIAFEDTHLFHTSSMFFRREDIVEELKNPPSFMLATAAEDRALFLLFATKGNIYYIDDCMSKYRIQSEGSWSSLNAKSKKQVLQTDKELLQMIAGFDSYTQGQFSEEVYAYQTIVYFRILQNERRFKELLDKRYVKLFQGLGKKQKIYYKMCAHFPFIGNCYYKIKTKMSKRESI
ncbi:MAG: glycosyltransferase family 2 protein [Suilimivivens sp.]